MNARQQFAIGYSAHGLGVGMPLFPAFVIECGMKLAGDKYYRSKA